MPRDDDRRGGRSADRAAPRGSRRDEDDRDERGRGGGQREEREQERGEGSRRASGGGGGYRARSSEDVARRAKQSSGRYDSFITEDLVWFKPRDGENCIRLLPWLFDTTDEEFAAFEARWTNHWGIDILVHRNVGADKGTYLCLDKMKGEPCAVCDAYREEEPDTKESLRSADRMLAWLIDRNDEKAGPKLWAMPLGTAKDFSAASRVKGTGEALLVDDPEEGYDIFFDKEGEKKLTKYKAISVDRDPSPLHENEKTQNRWLDFIADHRLPDLLKYYDEPGYLEKILAGQLSARDRDEDDEDGGGRARDRGRSRGRDREDPDEDRDARPSRSRSRDPQPETDDPPPRSSRRGAAEPEEEFSRPSRRAARGADAEPEDAPRSSRRGRAVDPEPEPEADEDLTRAAPRSSRRGAPPPDEEPPARSRARGRAAEPEEDAEPGEDAPPPRRGGGVERRRSSASEVKDEDIPFDDKEEVASARSRLKDVGKRRGR